MKPMTMQQVAEATGWSQRMLRYLEQTGLVPALRSPGGHRLYGERQVDRLVKLRVLLDRHGLGITDLGYERRMRTDPALAADVDAWFGALHRPGAPEAAGLYRRLTLDDNDYPAP